MISLQEKHNEENGDWKLVDGVLQLSSLLSVLEGYVDSNNQIPEMLHINVILEKMQLIVLELEKKYDTSNCFKKF